MMPSSGIFVVAMMCSDKKIPRVLSEMLIVLRLNGVRRVTSMMRDIKGWQVADWICRLAPLIHHIGHIC